MLVSRRCKSGTFEAAARAGVLPSEEAASLAPPDGDVAAAGALELDGLLPGGDLLSARDTGLHFDQLLSSLQPII